MVEDKRATVADQVAAKMDVGAWFATLTKRMKEIAKDLAFGCSTSEVAEKHGVSAGRISQIAADVGGVLGCVSGRGGGGSGVILSGTTGSCSLQTESVVIYGQRCRLQSC